MWMQNRLCKLTLQYNCPEQHLFERWQFAVPPYQNEEVTHYCRRLLSLLACCEYRPVVHPIHGIGKEPDLDYALDASHWVWVMVDQPENKLINRAMHQASCLVLTLAEPQADRWYKQTKVSPSVQVVAVKDSWVSTLTTMIKPSMNWSLWREQQQYMLTDGQQWLEFEFPTPNCTLCQ